MKTLMAILLAMCCGYAQADVYRWLDERGEAHFGESPPTPDAEKVMTQEQIKSIEDKDKLIPPRPAEDRSIDEEAEQRSAECQRYKKLKEDFLLNMSTPRPTRYGYGLGRNYNNGPDTTNLSDYDEIEAGVRRYCQ